MGVVELRMNWHSCLRDLLLLDKNRDPNAEGRPECLLLTYLLSTVRISYIFIRQVNDDVKFKYNMWKDGLG